MRKDKKERQQAEESGVSGDECPSWREGLTESSALRHPIRPNKCPLGLVIREVGLWPD